MARELCEGEEKSNEMVVGGFYYNSNNIQINQFANQIQTGFASATEPAEMYNNINHHHESTGGDEFDHDQNMMVVGGWGTTAAQDDSCLRCVFPCEANERPSQGLSLSLSSSNPCSIGLQSFELRPQNQQSSNLAIFQLRNSRFLGPTQELLYEFCSLGITNNNNHYNKQAAAAAPPPHCSSSSSPKLHNRSLKQWELEHDGSSSSTNFSLQSLDFIQLQKRKTKLFSMLEEVERRYRHYCEQMKGVVAAFETVAGGGAARVYTALASKAMSRHFRCLKDGILGQIEATKKAMGEKDPIAVAPGTTRGETPRLRAIDQALRQQRAFHQISLMETHPWRPQRGLPERSVSVLRAWLFEHFLHPYPSDVDKHILARQTGLSRSQVSNWFINARVRLWKPMVEEMYIEETKEREEQIIINANHFNDNSLDHGVADFDDEEIDAHRRSSIPTSRVEDQKPTPDQLLRIDSECLSSIVVSNNNSEKNDSRTTKTMQNHHHSHLHNNNNNHMTTHTFGRVSADAFGTVELDFSAYNHHTGSGGVSYPSNNNNQHFNNNGGGGGVSLTLGLQQHAAAGGGNGNGGGVSIAFSSGAAVHSSLFFTRDNQTMEECQAVQYSDLDGETQNIPYRNLMGAQLLHDLAG